MTQTRVWLGMAGVLLAATAAALGHRTIGWIAVGLLAASALWRLVERRRRGGSSADGVSQHDDS